MLTGWHKFWIYLRVKPLYAPSPAGWGLGHNNSTSLSPALVSYSSNQYIVHTGSTPQEPCSTGRPSDNPHRNSRTWYIKTAKYINISHTIHSLTNTYQSSLIIKSRTTWDQPRATMWPHPEDPVTSPISRMTSRLPWFTSAEFDYLFAAKKIVPTKYGIRPHVGTLDDKDYRNYTCMFEYDHFIHMLRFAIRKYNFIHGVQSRWHHAQSMAEGKGTDPFPNPEIKASSPTEWNI